MPVSAYIRNRSVPLVLFRAVGRSLSILKFEHLGMFRGSGESRVLIKRILGGGGGFAMVNDCVDVC